MVFFDGIIYSLQRYGGITVYFNELIRRFGRDADQRCGAVVYRGSSANPELFDRSRVEWRRPRFAERYRRCPVPADIGVFHSSYYRLPDRRVPAVTTVHDFIYERFMSGGRKLLHGWQKFAAIKGAQAVICISESTRRDLLEFLPNFPVNRLHVVYNGVNESFRPVADVAHASRLGKPYILYVGARGGYKNFEKLVYAIAGLPEFDLLCVGGGDLLPQEAGMVLRLLGGRFAHHSYVANDALNLLYNGAFCLVYPSSYEGFGIPVIEAMRAGCPVIAVNGSSIPEVAGDAALLVECAAPELLRSAIQRLEKCGERERLRDLGLRRAGAFSWDSTAIETRAVYEVARDA